MLFGPSDQMYVYVYCDNMKFWGLNFLDSDFCSSQI